MEEITNRFTSYEAYRQEVGLEIKAAQQSMVRIGYLLKVARDTDVLQGSAYKDYLEFAQAEFGLEKSTVSRFIGINDRFSVGGNSDQLLEAYEGFGRAKLQEMLMLPDFINEELTPDLTREEIKTIRQEVEEEAKVSDIEVLLERTEDELGLIDRFMRSLLENDQQMARRLRMAAGATETMKEIMMPDEVRYFTERVSGVGRIMLTLKQSGDNTLTNIRTGEKETTTWNAIMAAIEYVLQDPEIGKEEVKAEPKQEPKQEQEKPKVAPVQHKESKVHTPEKPKHVEKPKEEPAPDFMPEPEDEQEVVNWNTQAEQGVPEADEKEGKAEQEEEKTDDEPEIISASEEPAEGSHEWALRQMSNQELEKEAVACADQIRIDIYHFKSIEDMNWLQGAKEEHGKLAKTIEEIERRANNGTWRA